MARLAFAQNPAAAEALFEQARAAMSAGDYELACARFRDSDKLDAAVGTRLNLADCEEHRGRVATAWSLFRGVAAELPASDDRLPVAEERVRALEKRLPYLTLVRNARTPAGARVRMDGVELGEASFGVPLPLDPGAHELVLVAPDGTQERIPFLLKEGLRSDLPVQFTPPAAPSPPQSSEPATDDAVSSAPHDGESRRTWGYALGGIGVAGVVTGVVAGAVTLSKKSTANDHCNDLLRQCDDTGVAANKSGKTFGVVSGVGFGVGIAGLAAGAFLLLTAADPPAVAHSHLPKLGSVTVNPQLGWASGTGFLSLSGGF